MKITVQGETEFERFKNLTARLISVPHAKIKAKLDVENVAKARRKRKAKPAASRAADA